MKVLDLPPTTEWFDMIEPGEKKEEYRTIKPYWCKRLACCDMFLCWYKDKLGNCRFIHKLYNLNRLCYTHIRFRYGYTRRTMLFTLDGIRIGIGKPEWGAPAEKSVFILKLGNRIDSAWLH